MYFHDEDTTHHYGIINVLKIENLKQPHTHTYENDSSDSASASSVISIVMERKDGGHIHLNTCMH